MNRESVLHEVQKVPYWRHKIRLPFGILTPGRIGADLIRRLKLPNDLSGKTLLDIGTFDGLCAFEAERRSALRVLAVDTWHGRGSDDPGWWAQLHTGGLGFRVAKKVLGSKVESKELSVYNLSPTNIGKFDYVLMCGLLYHLRDPLTAIERALSVTRGVLIIESLLVSIKSVGEPILIFTKRRNREVHPANWWEFSRSSIEDLCYVAGARSVRVRSISWHPSTKRFLQLSGRIRLFEFPRRDSRVTRTISVGREVEVDSRRFTFRDGHYWLRIAVRRGKSPENPVYAWLRLPGDREPPNFRERAVRSDRREGRVVFWVTP